MPGLSAPTTPHWARIGVAGAWVVLLAGCSASTSGDLGGIDSAGAPLSAAWKPSVAEAATSYRAWGVVVPRVRWAPERCLIPPPLAGVDLSQANGIGAHARKLYALYASDPTAYLDVTDAERDVVPRIAPPGMGPIEYPHSFARADGSFEAPRGLILVKESYAPEEVDSGTVPRPNTHESNDLVSSMGFLPFAERDGKTYRTGARRDLFVMAKVALSAGAPADTDAGWIYGTVSPEGEVTSAGRVASCMECHARAPNDRLFGIPVPTLGTPSAK